MIGIKDAKCVLVIGATAGLGRALALAVHDLESKPTVIVAGRRQERLDELAKQSNRIKTARVDIKKSYHQLKGFVDDVVSRHPQLDGIILSSGIQHEFDFTKPETIDHTKMDDEYNTNYVAITRLIVLFLPHFLKLSAEGRPSFIVTITSGLAIVPKPEVPDYCATKAAIHSFTLSLRAQLEKTKINVFELMPPLVESELHDHQAVTLARVSKIWMPLDEWTKLTMEGLIDGKAEIPLGFSIPAYEKYEAGKQKSLVGGWKGP